MDSTDKTRAIVLKAIKYGDNSLIVKLLTEQDGLRSFMVKGAFNKTAKIRAALFQPLTLLDIISADTRGELGYLKEVSIEYAYKSIPYEINKNAIVLFLCELLSKSIQDSETDIELFEFIHDALTHLDEAEANYADFPLKFSIELSRHLGFAPNIGDYKPGYVFDLEEGCFRYDNANSIYIVDYQLGNLFYQLCKTSVFENVSLNLRNAERRQLLDAVIAYYKLHVSGFNEIKSNEILKTVLE
ncbi:MAG: DNA repair protein RecO [Bacteroidales bacterium]|nr:DNA repair protein RecO [Bacteroidales bacterium]